MSFLTGFALRRRSVTILVVILLLVGGIMVYRNLERELFPEIEFPNITIVTAYPFSSPDAVVRDVTEPIEEAIDGINGLKEIQSTSSENVSLVLATFEFGEDMKEAERTIESNINGISFPEGVEEPLVSRIANDVFPVLQLSISGDRNIPALQRIADDLVIPRIEQVPGVFEVGVLGSVSETVRVTVDTEELEELGLSMLQVSNALRDNNTSIPAGEVDQRGQSFPLRTTHEFGSVEDIRNLVIGFEGPVMLGATGGGQPVARSGQRPVLVGDVAEVALTTEEATSISRTNGKPSLNIVVIKEPDANTVDVTSQALESLDLIKADLPSDVEILILTNDGPEVQEQLNSLLGTGALGFLFAVAVVFIFLINLRPTLVRGLVFTLRPTLIISIAIPLSVMTAILLLQPTGQNLNFMTLAGLAIAVGRVVDDSIVVLENMYRHIQLGEERMQAAVEGTREVGAAIVSSTLTTVVVFIPLAFIQGLVGSFFTPFSVAVSLALIASTLIALTAVPVLGVILLRQGDFPDQSDIGGGAADRVTWMQRLYLPALIWVLGHKAVTVIGAAVITGASALLIMVIPITFFPAGTPEFLTIDVELPTGTSVGQTFGEVLKVEQVLDDYEQQGIVEAYQVSLGSTANEFGPGAETGGFHLAGFIVRLAEDVPGDIATTIRAALPGDELTSITVREIAPGPPTDRLEITVTGKNFTAISGVARQLEASLNEVDGIINLTSDITNARDEVVIKVDTEKAAEFNLTTALVGQQVNQYIVGRKVSEVDLEDTTLDLVVRGRPEEVDDIEKLKALTIEGPLGQVKLGSISEISIDQGPVSISRFDIERSASITGDIVTEDTQAVGRQIGAKIGGLDMPPGVRVKLGGIFQQIAEGFQDVFTAMAIGIILVYLVMVASLGSLRNPFVIVLSLPLALVGALSALAITDRTLSLSALMGFLLLIGVVVTNAIVLITFVEQLRERGLTVYEALVQGGSIRLRPILMTAFTTTFALLPLSLRAGGAGNIIGAEMATVVIGGLISSTFLTLLVVPVIYTIMHEGLPRLLESIGAGVRRRVLPSWS